MLSAPFTGAVDPKPPRKFCLISLTVPLPAALCLILLVLTGTAASAPPRQALGQRSTLSASVTLSTYGVDAIFAANTARSLALLDILQQANAILQATTAVRFSEAEPSRHLALASLVLPPLILTLPDEAQETVRAEALIFIPYGALGQRMQSALQQDDRLEILSMAFQELERVAHAAENELYLHNEEPSLGGYMQCREWEVLAASLETLSTYFAAISRFGSSWETPEDALPILAALRSKVPDNPLFQQAEASILLRLNKPHEALEAANRAIALRPDWARAFVTRGLVHLRQGLTSLALADFDQALQLQPNKAAWWLTRGAAHRIDLAPSKMCEDLYQACALGECEGIALARSEGICPE